MMIDPHSCCSYYLHQQRGGDIPYYYATQEGRGFFGNIFRTITPILKQAGSYFGKKILSAGSKVASDVASGENFKKTLKRRFIESGKDIRDDFVKRLQNGKGAIKRRRKNKRVIRQSDIFDYGSHSVS